MFTRIDHVTICVPDLQRGIEQFTKLGFNMHAAGAHPGRGTHNAIAFNTDDYIELLAIRDETEYKSSGGRAVGSQGTLPEFIAAGGGIRYVVIQSDDLVADVAMMRERGVEVGDPVDGGRRAPSGHDLRWRVTTLGAANPLPLVFIQQLTPVEERRKQVPGAGEHPNGVYQLERAYIVTADVETEAATYAKVLGMPQPKTHKGTVIMSDMAVFEIGPTGLGIAQPYADGPASAALKRRGPGPFQALYRTKSMDAAARWADSHGLPPLARGVRNTGEHAMLATPDVACGAYIGFVGPQ
ncbi:MAG TPA: VOC family protein [Burkholderiales bacterium]|nr:VOC family protein [Burkholderiales bacterium]